MNKRQKEVIQSQLKDEEAVIKKLKAIYNQALDDINQKILLLQADELTQSKIYQIEYQKALKMQIKAILDNMNANQYTDIQEYLKNCYYEGFLGTMYDLQGQGIPLVIPIDQNQVVKAITNDTKLSKSLYESLGFHVNTLKKQINAEISRGIANGYSYDIIARNIQNKTNMGLRRSIRIVRTESHRIREQATYEAALEAKKRGADIVKQWDSTMDKKTRPNHVKLDGQIRELEDPFEINGKKALYPSDFGVPHEDINCRCVALTRARWALDDDEITKMNNETGEIVKIKEKNFESFKKAYKEKANKITLKDKIKALNDSQKDLLSQINKMAKEAEEFELDFLMNFNEDSFNKANKLQSKILGLKDNLKDYQTKLEKLLKEFHFDFDSAIIDLKKYSNLNFDELKDFSRNAGKISEYQRRLIYGGSNGYIATSNSFGINEYLRTGNKDGILNFEKSLKTIEELEKVIKNNHASKDVILHRFVDSDYLNHYEMVNDFSKAFFTGDEDSMKLCVKEFNAIHAGQIETFKAFTSTSFDSSKNVFTDRPVKLTIHVPKGSNCYMTENLFESEIILNADSKFKIHGAKLDGGYFNIFLELIN